MEPYHQVGILSAEPFPEEWFPTHPMQTNSVVHALPSPVREAVDDYWASFLGCRLVDLHALSAVVVPHRGTLADYRGIFLLQAGGAPVVSLPPDLMPALASGAAHWQPSLLRTPAALRAELAPLVPLAFVGPAALAYVDRSIFAPDPRRAPVRPLTPDDEMAVQDLRDACSALEWESGGGPAGEGAPMGAFTDDGRLAAVAGYEIWGGRLAHLGFVTHPEVRGRGYGAAAVWAATDHALQADLIPQFRTLEANGPAMAVSRALGFAPYGVTVSIQLSRA